MAAKGYLIKIILVATSLTLLTALYFFVDARNSALFPKCIFYSLTGFYCPGCGSQRALSSLLHVQLWRAVNYNLLFVACLPLLMYSASIAVINVLKKKPVVQKIVYSPSFVKILLAIIITFWICRNLSLYPFNLLAPHEIT